MDCHGSLHSPHNDGLLVIANEVKQSSSFSSGLPRLITFASQWQVERSFHSLAMTANLSFILHDQSAHKVPLNCHYYQSEYLPISDKQEHFALLGLEYRLLKLLALGTFPGWPDLFLSSWVRLSHISAFDQHLLKEGGNQLSFWVFLAPLMHG